MEIRALACGNCGAPLKVPDTLRFVNCNHCGSTLEIKQTEDLTYSEKIDEIATRTAMVDGKLDELRLDHELGELRREWQVKHESERVTDKLREFELNRKIEELDKAWEHQLAEFLKANRDNAGMRVVFLIGGILTVCWGIVLGASTIAGARNNADIPTAIVTTVILLTLGVFAIRGGIRESNAYYAAEKGYLSLRLEVEQELDTLREKHFAG